MQKFKKERGWRIGDRLDTWDGPKIYRKIWLPHFNCFQVWARKLIDIYSMTYNVILYLENEITGRIYVDKP